MGLPKIGSYALPGADEVPSSRLSWKVDRNRVALLVHDMQNYFVRAFPEGQSPIAPAIANIARLRSACDAIGAPVFFTAQPGAQLPGDRGLQADFWGQGMNSVPEHRDIVDSLAPRESDTVLVKWRYSAFQRTNLEHLLRARGRDQLIVTGVFAHIGCLLSAADAFMHDVRPFFVGDAVADFSRQEHDAAMSYVSGCCGMTVTTEALLKQLTVNPPLTLERMRADIAGMLFEEPDAIRDDDNLIDLGLDSIRAMALVKKWNDAGIDIEFSSFAVTPELGYWWKLVSGSVAPR